MEEDPLDAEIYADARGTDSQELLLSRLPFPAGFPGKPELLSDDESPPPRAGVGIVISSPPGSCDSSSSPEGLELLMALKYAEETPKGASEGEEGGLSGPCSGVFGDSSPNRKISTSFERNVSSSLAIADGIEQLLPLKNKNVGCSTLKKKLLAGDAVDAPKSRAPSDKFSRLHLGPNGNSSNTVHAHNEDEAFRSEKDIEVAELVNCQRKENILGIVCNGDAIHVSKDVTGNKEGHQVEHIGKKRKILRFEESSHAKAGCKLHNEKLLAHFTAKVPSKEPTTLPKHNDEISGINSGPVCDQILGKEKGFTSQADKILGVTDSINSNCVLHSVDTEKLMEELDKFKYNKTGFERPLTFQDLVEKGIDPEIDGQMLLPKKVNVSGTPIRSGTLEKQAGKDNISKKSELKKPTVSGIVFKNFSTAITNIMALSKSRKSNTSGKELVTAEENAIMNPTRTEYCKEPDFLSKGLEYCKPKRKVSAEDDVDFSTNGNLSRTDNFDDEAERQYVVSNRKGTELGGCSKKIEILNSAGDENALNGPKEVTAAKGDADTGWHVKSSEFESGSRNYGKVPSTFLEAVKTLVNKPDQTAYDVDILEVAREKGIRFHYLDVECQNGISF